MSPLIQSLPPGPIDVVGDVHGEIDALDSIRGHLGYDAEGRHPEGRTLVFLGDLVDRGPDSPGVVAAVRRMVRNGGALCVLGNHELNLLRHERKHGNGWFFGEEEPLGARLHGHFRSRRLESQSERDELLEFFASLPVALESSALRVVHAYWDSALIEQARRTSRPRFLVEGASDALLEDPRHEKLALLHSRLRDQLAGPPDFDDELAEFQKLLQDSSGPEILLSGPERVIESRTPFFAGGQWRFVERDRWWERYRGVPVIVGHYWRKRRPTGRAGDMPDVDPEYWWGAGYVYCNDFSVGRRFVERAQGVSGAYMGCLGAVRYPEWQVMFDDGEMVKLKPPGNRRR